MSAGKFGTGKKKNPFAPYTRKGVVSSKEFGCVVLGTTGTEGENSLPLYVGHATHGNVALMTRLFWRCVVRDIFQLQGINVADMQTDSPGAGVIYVEYQRNVNNASDTFNQNCAGNSYIQIADGLYNSWDTIVKTNASRDLLIINEVLVEKTGDILAKRDYRDCYLHVLGKSDLKVQNRTVAQGTDEDANSTENVANCPLYGKSYTFKGSGLLTKVDSTAASQGKTLSVGEDTGVLAYRNNINQYWLKEPPLPTLFTPRPKFGSVRLEPGTIKTSSLMKKVIFKQSDFWQLLSIQPGGGTAKGANIQNRYGQGRIFSMEKMITVSAADTPPQVGLEMNLRYGMYLKFKGKTDSAEICDNQAFITAQA